MKRLLVSVLGSCTLVTMCMAQMLTSANSRQLSCDMPAQVWTEAFPLGNDQMGALVYGIPGAEQIQLNEEPQWVSSPRHDLRLVFPGHEWYSNYSRVLDLDSSRVLVEYQVPSMPGVTGPQPYYHHRREIFCSVEDSIMVVRLSTDDPRGLTFSALLTSTRQHVCLQEEDSQWSRLYVECDGTQLSRDGAVSVLGGQSAIVYVSLSKTGHK